MSADEAVAETPAEGIKEEQGEEEEEEEEEVEIRDCPILEVSPFDIHFSQEHIRATFQDGRLVDDTVEEIEVTPYPAPPAGAGDADGQVVAKAPEADGQETELYFIKVPFPRIEVIRWRCKLREADGTPKLDPVSGMQLFGQEEKWFSFDNRRLCCLQRAAARVWPKRAVCEVHEVVMSQVRARELRKFDTRTFGNNVTVNKKDDPPDSWCWRTAVGEPVVGQPDAGIARHHNGSLRRRNNQRQGGPNRGGPKGRRQTRAGGEEAEGSSEFVRSLSLFLLVYLALRFMMWAVRQDNWSFPERLLELWPGSAVPANATAPS